jgi:hypothetical protein
MTGYVSTRYYRAPEIMLTWQKYDVAGESESPSPHIRTYTPIEHP